MSLFHDRLPAEIRKLVYEELFSDLRVVKVSSATPVDEYRNKSRGAVALLSIPEFRNDHDIISSITFLIKSKTTLKTLRYLWKKTELARVRSIIIHIPPAKPEARGGIWLANYDAIQRSLHVTRSAMKCLPGLTRMIINNSPLFNLDPTVDPDDPSDISTLEFWMAVKPDSGDDLLRQTIKFHRYTNRRIMRNSPLLMELTRGSLFAELLEMDIKVSIRVPLRVVSCYGPDHGADASNLTHTHGNGGV